MQCRCIYFLFRSSKTLSKAFTVFKSLYITDQGNKVLLLQYPKPIWSLFFQGMLGKVSESDHNCHEKITSNCHLMRNTERFMFPVQLLVLHEKKKKIKCSHQFRIDQFSPHSRLLEVHKICPGIVHCQTASLCSNWPPAGLIPQQ